MTSVCMKTDELGTDMHRQNAEGRDCGDAHVSQELPRLPASGQKLGKRHGMGSPSLPRKEPTAPTRWSRIYLQNRENKRLLFQPLSLGHFVTVAPLTDMQLMVFSRRPPLSTYLQAPSAGFQPKAFRRPSPGPNVRAGKDRVPQQVDVQSSPSPAVHTATLGYHPSSR